MDFSNSRALKRSAKRGCLENVRELVKTVDVNVTDQYGLTALHHAAKKGHSNLVTFLIENGAFVDTKDIFGYTALHYASISRNCIFAVKALLKANADINARDKSDHTPLHVAIQKGHNMIVEVLLEFGANINAVNNNGWTSLHQAASNGQCTIVELLLKTGADYTLRTNKTSHDVFSEITAKELAQMKKYYSIVKVLQEYEDSLDVKEPVED